ncbi:hypothetical protein, conserved [Trypanosoma brucei gambiense DAL972]|uniref:BRCT domain-containing protein n=1 Tax=Trypanosoma brucei gambiense (strain MHOM/CI/86/DAL972) TaxID=679716 RepID=C9ZLC4_TRYB9|nr:hypothetical protein, conserved [Trypanosoma brucei gambiense DAL972]CBH10133.1 hypothetical protein, conserved [Trypanosoma brucei gambiense DAL972]|eukprot:XP_011772423.1 hypothetical protein, conserved [Trypanosoma brucei gambiense DAL972]
MYVSSISHERVVFVSRGCHIPKYMLVTTTAISGNDLELIKSKLEQQGMTYTETLTDRTNVLVARSTEGKKYALAKVHGIPCVTPEWVLSGNCSMDRVSEFGIDYSLRGLEVCTTSLDVAERQMVQRICETHQARYSPEMTRRCSVLVVPSRISDLSRNAKVQFARKYQCCVKPYCQFSQQYGGLVGVSGLRDISTRITALRERSGAVAYCFPPNLVSDDVKELIKRSGIRQAQTLTIVTTHVVLLGPTTEFFAPRPGLEFVSLSWLEECAAQGHGRVCAKPYVVSSVLKPVITFTAVPQEDREAFRNSLKRAGMQCVIQDDFVLGANNVGSFARSNTTHLVVGSADGLAGSTKVASLAWRRYKLRVIECFFVHVDWLHHSLVAGYWEDCSPFIMNTPQFSEFNKELGNATVASAGVLADGRRSGSSAYGHGLQRLSKDVTPRDSVLSSSLEHLIGELETKTDATSVTPTSPAVGVGQAQSRSAEDRGEGDVCACNVEVSFNALASSACGRRFGRETPPASQMIVYKQADMEQPQSERKEIEHRGVSPQSEKEGERVQIDDTPRGGRGEFSPSPCCIMLSRSLLHLEEELSQLLPLGLTIAISVEECTHYITERPSRTEYFLSAVAAGKWVLAPSFIKEARQENRIPPEEPHEWCPEMARRASLRNSVSELVKACQLQRRRTERPFASWTVALCCSTDLRTKSFARVLQSGGCKAVIPYTPQELVDALLQGSGPVDSINFVLSDDNNWEQEQLAAINSRLKVYRMEYIAHCLCTLEPDPVIYELMPKTGARKRPKDSS